MKKPFLILSLGIISFCIANNVRSQNLRNSIISLKEDNNASKSLIEFGKAVSNKRIVFLGDIIHGEANIDSARAVIIQYLIEEKGFNAIAFESGIYDLFKANQQMSSGDDIAGILGESIYNVWSGPSLEPLINIITKNRYNLTLLGFDPKFSGIQESDIGQDLADFFADNEIAIDSIVIDKWQWICDKLNYWDVEELKDSTFRQTMKTIREYLNSIPPLKKDSNKLKIWSQIILNVHGLYNIEKVEGLALKPDSLMKAKDYNTRDSLMALNLKFYLNLYPEKKVIAWGASGHFARNTQFLKSEELKEFKPMGSYFGSEALVVGSMGYKGRYGWTGNIHSMPNLPGNSIEFKLNRLVNKISLVNLASWKKEMPLYSSAYVEGSPVEGDWSEVFDWIIFANNIIPKIDFVLPMDSVKTNNSNLNSNFTARLSREDRMKILILKGTGVPIKGQVLDTRGSPIPYTTIALEGSSLGSVANEMGEFVIRIPKVKILDTLVFSNVAYTSKRIAIGKIDKNVPLRVIMTEKAVQLPEIIISQQKNDALSILNEAIKRIDENYDMDPFCKTILQHRIRLDSITNQAYTIDWTAQSYYSKGYHEKRINVSSVGFDLKKSRMGLIDSLDSTISYVNYTVPISELIGFNLLDQILYRRYNFLNVKNQNHYTFKLSGIVQEGGQHVFKINFVCNKPSFKTTLVSDAESYRGIITIRGDDYAIIKIETEATYNEKDFNRNKRSFITSNPNKMVIRREALYKKTGNYYYLYKSSFYDNFIKHELVDYTYFNLEKGQQKKFIDNYEIRDRSYDTIYWEGLMNYLLIVKNQKVKD